MGGVPVPRAQAQAGTSPFPGVPMRFTLTLTSGVILGTLTTLTVLRTWRRFLLHALSRGD